MKTVPDWSPFAAAPRKPILAPLPDAAIPGPPVPVLSGCPGGTLGQVNVSPPWLTVAPWARPALASPCAEKLNPPPSKLPAVGLLSSLMRGLLYVAASDGCAPASQSRSRVTEPVRVGGWSGAVAVRSMRAGGVVPVAVRAADAVS